MPDADTSIFDPSWSYRNHNDELPSHTMPDEDTSIFDLSWSYQQRPHLAAHREQCATKDVNSDADAITARSEGEPCTQESAPSNGYG